eukprot:GEMP01096330.1.p1 GENE.GEMP01096330.1~~GEMP01096330.1.p1  ORF type:complete len:139 (+),score=21.36 GEMP01096330.1:64-480(+)
MIPLLLRTSRLPKTVPTPRSLAPSAASSCSIPRAVDSSAYEKNVGCFTALLPGMFVFRPLSAHAIWLDQPSVEAPIIRAALEEPLLFPTMLPLDLPAEVNDDSAKQCKADKWRKRRRKKVGVQSAKWMRRAAFKGRLA